MVEVYVHGKKVGKLPEDNAAMDKLLQYGVTVEFRSETGSILGKFVPSPEPVCPWEPSLTEEEIQRQIRAGGKSLAEILRQLGA